MKEHNVVVVGLVPACMIAQLCAIAKGKPQELPYLVATIL